MLTVITYRAVFSALNIPVSVSSSLEGREKRKYEDQLVRKLGGKGRKPDKMPYPLYQEVVKRRKEKERKKREQVCYGAEQINTYRMSTFLNK